MSCMLRAGGDLFDVDAFLQLLGVAPFDVWRVAEPDHKGRPMEWSGFSLQVSDADFDDVPGQIDDVIEFLQGHHAMLTVLSTYPGVEVREFDFGIEDRDGRWQEDALPAELLRLAGNLNIGLRVSRYPRSLAARDEGAVVRPSGIVPE